MDGYTVALLSFFALLFVTGVLAAMALLLTRQPAPQPALPVWPAEPQPAPHGTAWEPAEWQLCGTWEDAVMLADPAIRLADLRAAWLDYHSRNSPHYFCEADAFQPPVRCRR